MGRARGPAPPGRPRIQVPDGARATPKGLRRFRAIPGAPPPHARLSNRRGDGIPGESTAGPDTRQPERPMPRVTVGSAMRSRHPRTAEGIPGHPAARLCLSGGRMADPARKVHEKEAPTDAQPTDNEKKI